MKKATLPKMLGTLILSTVVCAANAQDSVLIKTTADAFTWDRTAANQNTTPYGNEGYVYAKIGAGMSNTDYGFPSSQANTYKRYAYLQFPTSSLPASTIFSKVLVRIRAYGRDAGVYRYNGLKISKSNADLWNESTLTWSNQPTLSATADSINIMHYGDIWTGYNALGTSATPASTSSITSNSIFLYIDITNYINDLLSSNTLPSTLGFVIQGFTDGNGYGTYKYADAARGNNGIYFLSKEYGIDSLAPTLVIYTQETTLPVNASPLSAVKSGKHVRLSWTTYSETNAAQFIIERSTDGKTFTAIDSVAAIGNSNKTQQYMYVDNYPVEGISFYRWKENDLDGKIQYSSNIASINLGTTLAIQTKIYPNPIPAGHTLLIAVTDTKEEIVQIQLVDLAGKIVSTKTLSAAAGTQTTSITTSGLAKGIYFVRLLNKSGIQITDTEKVVVK